MRALDGTIAGESTLGAGTSFRLTFRDCDQPDPDATGG
jgi:hypothetical protein